MISDNHLPTSQCFSIGMIVQTRISPAHLRGFVLRNRGMDQTTQRCRMKWSSWNKSTTDQKRLKFGQSTTIFLGIKDFLPHTAHKTTPAHGYIRETISSCHLRPREKGGNSHSGALALSPEVPSLFFSSLD